MDSHVCEVIGNHLALEMLHEAVAADWDSIELQVSVLTTYANHVNFDVGNLSENQFHAILALLKIDILLFSWQRDTMLSWFATIIDNMHTKIDLIKQQVGNFPQQTFDVMWRINKLEGYWRELDSLRNPHSKLLSILSLSFSDDQIKQRSFDMYVMMIRDYVRFLGASNLTSVFDGFSLVTRAMSRDAVRSPNWESLTLFIHALDFEHFQVFMEKNMCDDRGVINMDVLFNDSVLYHPSHSDDHSDWVNGLNEVINNVKLKLDIRLVDNGVSDWMDVNLLGLHSLFNPSENVLFYRNKLVKQD
jgi:hypothetical protein